MINKLTWTQSPSRAVMPISGHPCALGMTDPREAVIVRDRALTGVVPGSPALGVVLDGAFVGPDAWSPPI